MRFQTKTKRIIALKAVAVLTATVILPRMYLTPHAVCSKNHEWTGLKLCWTDIPAATGGNLQWPRKTYFDGGPASIKEWIIPTASVLPTIQASMGQEVYLQYGAGALLIQDYFVIQGK